MEFVGARGMAWLLLVCRLTTRSDHISTDLPSAPLVW